MYLGIDPRQQKTISNKCGNIDYLPFTPHPWGPDYIYPFNETTEDPILDFVDPGSIYFTSAMAEKWEQANESWFRNKGALLPPLDASASFNENVVRTESFSFSKEISMLGFLLFLGGVLLFGALVGIWDGRILHIGKSHRAASESDGFLKTV